MSITANALVGLPTREERIGKSSAQNYALVSAHTSRGVRIPIFKGTTDKDLDTHLAKFEEMLREIMNKLKLLVWNYFPVHLRE